MGEILTPNPVKLIVAMLSGRPALLEAAGERLSGEYGPIDLAGEVTDFDFTHYYDRQMGGSLKRRLVAFERPIDPGDIVAIKLRANEIEAEFAAAEPEGPARPVNLDPGYVTEGKLVLASTKDFAHRVYLGRGIYAEATLQYANGRWTAGKQTFPDYASGAYDAFLDEARRRLREQLGRKERR